MTEYKLSYTANEIDQRLGKVTDLEQQVIKLSSEKVDKTDITLGLHAGKLYVFIGGAPVGEGIELSGGGGGDDIPTYYYTETARIINLIETFKSTRNPEDYMIFGAVSDIHLSSDGNENEELGKKSLQHAAYALDVVGSAVGCDFVASFGDNCEETHIDPDITTSPCGLENAEFAMNILSPVFNKQTSFNLVGNHDKTNKTSDQYNLIGVYNDFDVASTTTIRGFGYKDFTDKKVRVIVLNTADYLNASGGCALSYEQKDFLMRALDLSRKADCAEWQILLLSHIPLDWNGGDYNFYTDLQAILNAYEDGTTASITVNPSYAKNEAPSNYPTFSPGKTNEDDENGVLAYGYSGKNKAKIIANIHGHLHNNKIGKIANTNIARVTAANTSPYGNTSERYPTYGDYSITTEEASKLVKTAGTARDTSATFYCIDLDEKKIYEYVYGARNELENREIIYKSAKTYSVTYNLTNCTLTNTATQVVEGESYTTRIIPVGIDDVDFEDGVDYDITMGGIPAGDYNAADGTITIQQVMGDIVITISVEDNYVPHWDIADRTAVSDMYRGTGDTKTISRDNYYWGAFQQGSIDYRKISSCSVSGNDVTFVPTGDAQAGIGVPFHLEAGASYTFSATASIKSRLRWCVLNADGTAADTGSYSSSGTSLTLDFTAPTDTSQWVMLILGGYTVDQAVTFTNVKLTKN